MSETGFPQPRDLGLGFFYAVLALIASAAVLCPAYLMFSPELGEQRAAAGDDRARPWPFSGDSLIARRGKGEETREGGLEVTELEGGLDSRAIFTRRAGFRAEDYPYLEHRVSGQNADTFYYFIWRSTENPDETSHIALPRINDRAHVSLLADHPRWRGTITEIGVDVYGDLRGGAQTIEHLTMLPTSALSFMRAIWSEWAGLETWNQRSAHHLMGGPYNPILARPLAMAAWTGGALCVLLLLRLTLRCEIRIAVVIAVLIPWLVIDMLWQRNLSAQLAETRLTFGGKTQHQKHLAELDGPLYEYAEHLKNTVLPEAGVKIYLLHDSPRRDYRRLKLQFYLLPHNIYNFDRFPRQAFLSPGDYLLQLGGIPGLNYAPATGRLQWNSHSVPVQLVDSSSQGQVFRVQPRAAGKGKGS